MLATAISHKGQLLPQRQIANPQIPAPAQEQNAAGPDEDPPVDLAPLENSRYGLLLCGIDNTSALADVILYVQLDLKNGTARLLQIPRDLFVGEQYSTGKINAACLPFSNSNPASRIAGIIERQLALSVDGCLSITMAGVRALVDAVGGVTVELPQQIDYLPGKTLPAGVQTLTGEQAEWLLRYRQGYEDADLGRLKAQKLFLSGAVAAAKRVGRAGALKIAVAHFGHVKTTVSLAKGASLLYEAMEISPQNIEMLTLPTYGATYRGYSVLCAGRFGTARMLNDSFLKGNPVSPWSLQLAYPPPEQAPPVQSGEPDAGLFDFGWDYDDYPELDDSEGIIIQK
jgi:LCP family protein required for cell wall assembly